MLNLIKKNPLLPCKKPKRDKIVISFIYSYLPNLFELVSKVRVFVLILQSLMSVPVSFIVSHLLQCVCVMCV